MTTENTTKTDLYPFQFTTRKVIDLSEGLVVPPSDSVAAWIPLYLQHGVHGVRSADVTQKIIPHMDRFRQFIEGSYGHDRVSTVLKRDVVAWRERLVANPRRVTVWNPQTKKKQHVTVFRWPRHSCALSANPWQSSCGRRAARPASTRPTH